MALVVSGDLERVLGGMKRHSLRQELVRCLGLVLASTTWRLWVSGLVVWGSVLLCTNRSFPLVALPNGFPVRGGDDCAPHAMAPCVRRLAVDVTTPLPSWSPVRITLVLC